MDETLVLLHGPGNYSRLLVLPMVTYVFYMFGLAVLNFRTRLHAGKTGQVDRQYFKAMQGPAPERVINVSRHFDNQFQVPLVFFSVCLGHMILAKADQITIALAWFFVLTRFLHTYIHLGKNQVRKRVLSYTAGWLVVLGLWSQLAWFALFN